MSQLGQSVFVLTVVGPVVLIGVAAIVAPLVLTPRSTRSQRRLSVSVLLSAILLFVLSAILFGILYQAEGKPLLQMLPLHPMQTLWFLTRRAGLAALIWVPLMLLAWLSLARRIEQLKAQDGMGIFKGEQVEDQYLEDQKEGNREDPE